MSLCKVIIYSTEDVIVTAATAAIEQTMNWDFVRAHRFCQEAGKNGSSVLCVAPKKKAMQYVQQLEEQSLFAECLPI